MKEDYIGNQMLLRTEQEFNFAKSMDMLHISLLTAIQGGKEKEVEAAINALLNSSFHDYMEGEPEIAKLYLAAFYSDLIEQTKISGLPAPIAVDIKKSAFQKLACAKSESDIKSISLVIFRELFFALQRYNITVYSLPVRRALEHIHNMIMQPISPGTVAEQLGMNRTYLSKRFSQEVGTTMTDYIHSAKMDMAEKLLAGRNYSLLEISNLLGYESFVYFKRIFRKYKGVLPSQWRPENRQTGDDQ